MENINGELLSWPKTETLRRYRKFRREQEPNRNMSETGWNYTIRSDWLGTRVGSSSTLTTNCWVSLSVMTYAILWVYCFCSILCCLARFSTTLHFFHATGVPFAVKHTVTPAKFLSVVNSSFTVLPNLFKFISREIASKPCCPAWDPSTRRAKTCTLKTGENQDPG